MGMQLEITRIQEVKTYVYLGRH